MANHFVAVFHHPERVVSTPARLIPGMGFDPVLRRDEPGVTVFEWRQPRVGHAPLTTGYPLRPEHIGRGEWSALVRRGEEWVAQSSLTMSEHIYWAQAPGVVVVGNRALLVAQQLAALGLPVSLDAAAMTSLVSKGYPCCAERTAIREVALLGDATLHIDPARQTARRVPRAPLSFKPEPGQRPDWDQLAQLLIDNARMLNDLAGLRTRAALTGGKDSRLVLAALVAADRHRVIDSYYIGAREAHADARVAARLAARYELPVERVGPVALDADLSVILDRHVLMTEGMLNAWDIKFVETAGDLVGVHGLLGEVYRRQRPADDRDARSAAQRHYASQENMGGIVRAEVFAAQQQDVERWFASLHEAGMPWEWAPDLFYLKQRIPRWMGQAKLHDSLGGVHFNLLFHEQILSAYYMLDAHDRGADRVHFELMWRLAPALVSEPFAQSRWDAAMVARSTAPQAPLAEAPIEHGGPIMELGWQLPLLRRAWPALRPELDAALTAWVDVLDVPRCLALLDAAELCLELTPVSRLRAARLSATHPIVVARGYKNPKKLTQAVLGLLTLVRFSALLDKIKADASAL